MRHAFPSLEPYPFGACHVNERSVDRAVTDLEVVSPLLFGQILSRVEREAVGVVGVIEESAYVVEIHSFSLETPWVRVAYCDMSDSAPAIAPAILALFFNRAMFARSARP